jgi:hypothetical protein
LSEEGPPPPVQLFLPFGQMEEGINRLLWKAATVEEAEALSEILYEHRRGDLSRE